jgi:hypothetical protein
MTDTPNTPEVNKEVTTEKTAVKTSKTKTHFSLGIAIVFIGLILLAKNLGYEFFFLNYNNWWAVFILVAAVGPLTSAFSHYQKSGFGYSVANHLVSAGAIIFIALLFLLDLRWQLWWPMFIIIGGLYLITNKD